MGGRFEVYKLDIDNPKDKKGKFIRELTAGFNPRRIKVPEKGSAEYERLAEDSAARKGIESHFTKLLQDMLKDKIMGDLKGAGKEARESK